MIGEMSVDILWGPLWCFKEIDSLTWAVWVYAGIELKGPNTVHVLVGCSTHGGSWFFNQYLTWAPTSNAEDVERLRLFHLPIQLSPTHVGPVLQRCLVPLTGNIMSSDGQVSVPIIQGDVDVWVGDHTRDGAFLTGLSYHAMGALYEPYISVYMDRNKTHFR